MTRKEIHAAIAAELVRAKKLFPSWPMGEGGDARCSWSPASVSLHRVEEAAIIAEEAGEVIQAALNLRMGDPHAKDTTIDDYRKEIVQTAAMCFRALEGL